MKVAVTALLVLNIECGLKSFFGKKKAAKKQNKEGKPKEDLKDEQKVPLVSSDNSGRPPNLGDSGVLSKTNTVSTETMARP